MPEQKPAISPNKRPSGKRTVVFKTIGVLLPFLMLFLLEVSLRLFHYGHNFNLFIEYPGDQNYLVLNPDASKRYFTNPALAPTGNRELFKKEKDKNTCRIFVLGESTTIGYPYFHNGSFHRWLQYRLMQTFPDRNFEIINLSITAVNSYTVLGFAKELVDYEPDAVLIYSGHNEYYGALGVGSTSQISGNRQLIQWILALRQLRITQLIGSLYQKMIGAIKTGNGASGETLMQMMVADQQIPFGSKLYYRGIEQFRSNMDETLDIFFKRHIPVFISNLVSNEKDLKPFISIGPDSVLLPGFKKNYDAGIRAFEYNEAQASYGSFTKANQLYGGHALCNYYLGRLLYAKGDYKQAAAYFSRARDLDGLRFRAPAPLNEIIQQLCNKYSNVHLVDTKTAFESCTPDHIIGNELMLEHVHPNLTGYALMSDVFYEALKKERIFPVDSGKEMSFRQLKEKMPITVVDSLTGLYKIARLKASWPFNEALKEDSFKIASDEQKMAYGIASGNIRWPEGMENLYDLYIASGQLIKAKTVLETLVLEHPAEATYYERTANVFGKLNDFEHAAVYFKKAFALSPSPEQARVLFVLYLDLDRPVDAMPYIDYTLNNQSDRRFQLIKQNTDEIIQLENRLTGDSVSIPVLTGIADKYYGMGNKAGALKYLGKIINADPGNQHALALQTRLKEK